MVTLDQGGLGTRLGQRYGRPRRGAEGIEGVWTLESRGRVGAGGWRVVPDTHPHAIVHRLASGAVRASLVGARSRWIDVDPRERAWTVGVRLSPGTLTALTGAPAHALTDRSVSLPDALGAEGAALQERLAQTEDAACALGLLVALVRARLEDACPVDWRARGYLRALDASPGGPAAAADRMGISERSLREVSGRWIGLSPKAAERIRRLHAALGHLVAGPLRTGAGAAAAAGYADQSHFIRDCHDLLGETPEAFRRRGHAGTSKTTGPDEG